MVMNFLVEESLLQFTPLCIHKESWEVLKESWTVKPIMGVHLFHVNIQRRQAVVYIKVKS